MSPILVRPVREQLEHDRIIRLLQAKYKRKSDVGINPGNEQTAPVTIPPSPSPWYPDLVLQSADRGRKLLGTVEVETAESVNNLEAMSQWATFSRLRAPFHLYIPDSSIDTAKRLCADLQISVAEIWAYGSLGDQMRFTLVQRSAGSSDVKGRAAAAPRSATPATRPAASTRARSSRPTARPLRATSAAGSARSKKTGKAVKKSAARVVGTRKTAPRSSRTQKRK